jgi:LexA-binding, inner membrane-associated putative hydrolase
MFVGHFAVGLAGKRVAPKVSLGTLILAAAFSDVLWIIFLASGIEQVVIQPGIMVANSLNLVSIPFSHSLLMDAVWGGLFAGIYFLFRHDTRGAWVLFAAVVSHWILDVATHRPDMQLAPGVDLRLGLALWNSRLATFIVEGALWFGAIVLYAQIMRPTSRVRVYAFWIIIVLLTLLWIVSLRGDPPPSLKSLAIVNTVFFVIVAAWAYWIDRVNGRTTG